MPSVSQKQHNLMEMALHDPSKVSKKNSDVLKMSKGQLKEYTSTMSKYLPKKKT